MFTHAASPVVQRELVSGVGDSLGVMVQSFLVVVSVIFVVDVLVTVLIEPRAVTV